MNEIYDIIDICLRIFGAGVIVFGIYFFGFSEEVKETVELCKKEHKEMFEDLKKWMKSCKN